MIIKDYKSARHLSSRLEIGVNDAQTKSRVGLHVADVLKSMIPVEMERIPVPALTPWEDIASFHSLPLEMKHKVNRQARLEGRHLTSWWLKQICHTKQPLVERMTIFWHGHFTTDANKVVWPQFVYRQNQFLRKHALGNFADMLHGIVRDPAMLRYLDATGNTKTSINENFAREILELFTLGEGNYSEADIINVARAFTGLGIDFKEGGFKFRKNLHDNGMKKFLGRRGRFNSEDIINIILQEHRTAEHIAEKFWGEFINHNTPDPKVIKYWAKDFRDSGYEIKALLNQVVHSQAFWSEENRGLMFKSPVEFSIGMMRELNLDMENFKFIRKAHQQLGQDLLYPPDVKGWRGGKDWITNNRLIRRYDLIPKIIANHTGNAGDMLEENILSPMIRGNVETHQLKGLFNRLIDKMSCSINSDGLVNWLLAEKPVLPPACDESLVNMFYVLLKDPAYQLK